MASTSRVSRVGVAGAPLPGAGSADGHGGGSGGGSSLGAREGQALGVVARRDPPTPSRRGDARAARGGGCARAQRALGRHRRARHEPVRHLSRQDPAPSSRILEAATYVRTHGAEASAEDAASRGITAGCLSSVALSLLGDLEDVLLTSKLHEAFLAAVKIQDYRSRLYVLRLLLERVPSDRLAATRHLVEVLAAHALRRRQSRQPPRTARRTPRTRDRPRPPTTPSSEPSSRSSSAARANPNPTPTRRRRLRRRRRTSSPRWTARQTRRRPATLRKP